MSKNENAYGLFVNKSTEFLVLFLSHTIILGRYQFPNKKLVPLMKMYNMQSPSENRASSVALTGHSSPSGSQGYKLSSTFS